MEHRRIPGLVSVIVPCWNRRDYIETCLNYLAKQTYRNIEIIVVDDGSTDDTVNVFKRWRERQQERLKSRICLISVPRNMGYAGAMTTGMFMSRGEYIALQDSDDYSHPTRLTKQIDYLKQHPDVGLVGSSYRVVHKGHVDWSTAPNWLRYGVDNVRRSYAAGAHCITVGSVMLRGRLFDRYGGMNRRAKGAEDWAFVADYLGHGVKADNLRKVLYFIRRHPKQRSITFYKK